MRSFSFLRAATRTSSQSGRVISSCMRSSSFLCFSESSWICPCSAMLAPRYLRRSKVDHCARVLSRPSFSHNLQPVNGAHGAAKRNPEERTACRRNQRRVGCCVWNSSARSLGRTWDRITSGDDEGGRNDHRPGNRVETEGRGREGGLCLRAGRHRGGNRVGNLPHQGHDRGALL